MNPDTDVRLYHAIVWKDGDNVPGVRVTVWATSLDEAAKKLEEEHDKGSVFTLHNEEDAARPR